MSYVRSIEQRFWGKISKQDDGCWLWTGTTRPHGYGSFYDGEKIVRAHRFAYEYLVGAIPDGLQLDHLCRIKNCVNPSHLEPVTSRENTLRGLSPIVSGIKNTMKTHCPKGHRYDVRNTYYAPKGNRVCRKCWRDKARETYRAKRKALC